MQRDCVCSMDYGLCGRFSAVKKRNGERIEGLENKRTNKNGL